MAIYYYKGTLSGASSTLAHDVRRAWKSEFDNAIAAGKTNWTVVEHNYTPGGATSERTVISNSAGFVFAIVTSTTSSTTTINTYLAESYTTPTLTNLAMAVQSGVAGLWGGSTNTSGICTATYNPTAVAASANAPAPFNTLQQYVATSSQSAYTVHIENDYAILSFNDGSASKGKWLYVGKYTSLVGNTSIPSATTTKPVVMVMTGQGNSSSQSHTAFLQAPNVASTTISSTGYIPGGWTWSLGSDGSPADSSQIDILSATPSNANVAPLFLTRAKMDIVDLPTTSGGSSHGYLYGKLTGAWHAGSSNATYGDTISVDGVTYMYVGGTSKAFTGSAFPALWARIS